MANNKGKVTFDKYLTDFRNKVKSQGLNNSYHREMVLKALYFQEKLVNPIDIRNILKSEYRIKIGVSTIYRSLHFLYQNDFIDLIEYGKQAYYCIKKSDQTCYFACKRCEKVAPVFDEQISALKNTLSTKEFELERSQTIILCICKKCKNKIEMEQKCI